MALLENTVRPDGVESMDAKLPFVSYAAADAKLVTGQNPGSAKEAARKVAARL